MPKILSVGTAVPPHKITQKEAKSYAMTMFKDHFKDIHRLLTIFEHTNINKRHFCVPLKWFEASHSFEEKNSIYKKSAIELSKIAILSALDPTPFSTRDVDHIIFVSSTGISTPTIDAFLFNDPEISFKSTIKRTPIWGLGCAGGAAGLSRAFDYCLAHPTEKVLVIALEIGELAFLKNDLSKSNLIATSLFADGAAAVLVVGDQVENKKDHFFKIMDTNSTIWPNTLDIMGWEVKNDGLKVVFSKNIPSIISKKLKPTIDDFLHRNELTIQDIHTYILHPGGTKVIEAYMEVFHITDDMVSTSKEVLEEYGNMSSPTVLFVLKETLEYRKQEKGYGLLLALGPGFSSEMLLLKWG